MARVIAIGGPSASGKSTLAHRLTTALGSAVHVQQDLFFIDPDCYEPDANFCEPRFLDGEAFTRAVNDLAGGRPATVPKIDFRSFRRIGTDLLLPQPFIIVEGMTVLRDRVAMGAYDAAYYVATPWNVLEERKRRRDLAERGKSAEIIERQLDWMRIERAADLNQLSRQREGGCTVRYLMGLDVEDDLRMVIADLKDLFAL